MKVSNLNGIGFDAAAGSSDCYAVGANGLLLYSSNNGIQWQLKDVQSRADLNAVDANNGSGLIVGRDQIINIVSGNIGAAIDLSGYNLKQVAYEGSGTPSYAMYEKGIVAYTHNTVSIDNYYPNSSMISANAFVRTKRS